jgi:glycosyltransferase involved in cell wall biosynthesis
MAAISVILPTYCHCGSLINAVQSVLDQSYKEFELIMIDDGSTDGTRKILENFRRRDQRVKVYRHESNSGCPARICNQAIKNYATGQYIAFQFDDDYWFTWCLEYLVRKAGNFDFLFGQSVYINYSDKTIRGVLGNYDLTKEKIINSNYIANNAVLIRRRVFLEAGGFDEHPLLTRVCDWELWIRLLFKGYRIHRIPQLLGVCYTGQPGSVGVTFDLDIKRVKEYIRNNLSKQRLI